MAESSVISPVQQNSTNIDRPKAFTASGGQAGTLNTELQTEAGVGAVRNPVPPEVVKASNETINQREADADNENVSTEQLDQLMENMNVKFEQLENYLRFEKDEDTEKMVIFIKNSETGEVIRQIPSKEFIAISKHISEYLEMQQQLSEKIVMPPGLLTNEKA